MNFIFLGPQASGKGTQAILLSKKLSTPHISTGDIFREAIKKGDELGKTLQSYIEAGNLVPDDLTNKTIEKRLRENDIKNGFILDGFPRTIDQAEFLDKIIQINKVIDIQISDKEAVHRISSRRSCACGKTYNLLYNPPKKENICDLCGAELFVRSDDKPESVKIRLETYHQKTKPLVDYYKEKNILITIDGERPIETIYEDIINKISK
ncbi:adenylate kinase [Candidatus Falkowbacteria bacterium]|jgi:adenylate kinase|nr:adenylate kinase [Candidatus Falkowbacteria bacterium]MBT4433014.1 adenylate kinase [Candidatus Falkowbacteria bacterium]